MAHGPAGRVQSQPREGQPHITDEIDKLTQEAIEMARKDNRGASEECWAAIRRHKAQRRKLEAAGRDRTYSFVSERHGSAAFSGSSRVPCERVPIIDLHYQTTEAALSLLDELWPSLLACGHQYAIIITGRGRHSGEGGPRIPARVADWLHNKGYRGNKMRRAGDGAKVLVDLL